MTILKNIHAATLQSAREKNIIIYEDFENLGQLRNFRKKTFDMRIFRNFRNVFCREEKTRKIISSFPKTKKKIPYF